MNLGSLQPYGNNTAGRAPANRIIKTTLAELGALIEDVVISDDELIWPVLSVLERFHLTAGQLPIKTRQVVQAEFDRAREHLLFDRRVMAAAIAIAVERRLVAEEIIARRRS